MSATQKIKKAMDLIESYGQIDGAHHKDWVLDQVARVLMGDGYDAWVARMKVADDGVEYDYSVGIAP